MKTDLIILKQLNTLPDSLTSEGALQTYVNLELPTEQLLTINELRSRLGVLAEGNQVVGVSVEGVRKWQIAPLGQARLARAGA